MYERPGQSTEALDGRDGVGGVPVSPDPRTRASGCEAPDRGGFYTYGLQNPRSTMRRSSNASTTLCGAAGTSALQCARSRPFWKMEPRRPSSRKRRPAAILGTTSPTSQKPAGRATKVAGPDPPGLRALGIQHHQPPRCARRRRRDEAYLRPHPPVRRRQGRFRTDFSRRAHPLGRYPRTPVPRPLGRRSRRGTEDHRAPLERRPEALKRGIETTTPRYFSSQYRVKERSNFPSYV